MALAEPSSELYAKVKAIWDPWPPDSEDAARSLGQAWRQASATTNRAAAGVGAVRSSVGDAWRDQAGATYQAKLGEGAQSLAGLGHSMLGPTQSAQHYGAQLTDAKSVIIRTIATNQAAYEQLKNPAFGAEGAAMRQEFVRQIAQHLRSMILGKAAALQGGAGAADGVDPTSYLTLTDINLAGAGATYEAARKRKLQNQRATLRTNAAFEAQRDHRRPWSSRKTARELKGTETKLKNLNRNVGRTLKGLGAVTAGLGVVYDIRAGESVQQAVVSNGLSFGASVGAGALAGSLIGGPVGTFVGGVVGAGAYAFTSGMVDSWYEDGFSVGHSLVEGAESVASTAQDLGNIAQSAGEAVVGGAKDAWNAIF